MFFTSGGFKNEGTDLLIVVFDRGLHESEFFIQLM